MKNVVYFILLITLILFASSCKTEEPDVRPNIILILVDDMGFSDLGCYGSEISTPNIDKLAETGMRFTQFHNTSKCFPSRASLLTGLYAHQVGNSLRNDTLKNSVTLGEVLKESGYRTLMVGKHHGKENMVHRGFDRYYGLRAGACNHFNPGEKRVGEDIPAHKTSRGTYPRKWCIDSLTVAPYNPPQNFYTTDYFTNYAVKYLDQYKDESIPFFLYLAYTAPHDPLMAWPEDISKYENSYVKGYEEIRKKRYEKQISIGLLNKEEYPLSDPNFNEWEKLSKDEKQIEIKKMAVYAAMIDRLDQNIGKIIAKLRAINKDQNTIIFFCSDNGASAEVVGTKGLNPEAKSGGIEKIGTVGHWASLGKNWANVSNTPYKLFKNYTHEGGICTPLIVNWPEQIKENSITDFNGHFIDFMPTLIELSNSAYPNEFKGHEIPSMEGESFVDILIGDERKREKPIFWEWRNGKGIWKNGYKLVSDNSGDWELYDTNENKSETKNLAAEKIDMVEKLNEDWQTWKRRMEAYEN